MLNHQRIIQRHSIPTDFLEIVIEILEQCCVGKFVMHVQGMKTNHKQKVKTLTLGELLNEAEQKYILLEGSNEWLGHSEQKSLFFSDDGCWICGS